VKTAFYAVYFRDGIACFIGPADTAAGVLFAARAIGASEPRAVELPVGIELAYTVAPVRMLPPVGGAL
jgi:hypothetical protein